MKKTVLITGASGAIGAATAAYFAQNGYHVAVHYHNNADGAKTLVQNIRKNGGDAEAFSADLTDSAAVNGLVQAVLDTFGSIEVLVNNAGIAQQKLLTDLTDADWQKMLATNLSAVFYACRAVVPQMLANGGSIVNVSSMWGVSGAAMESHYSAAKAGVIGFTKALAKELGPSNIRVNAVAPGVIDSKMNSGFSSEVMRELAAETPLCRIGTPQEVARAIYFLAVEGGFITGQTLGVDGGFIL